MLPSEIAARLRVLNTDLELSGEHRSAELVAQATAYLLEYESVVRKLDEAGAMLGVLNMAVNRLRTGLSDAQARMTLLEHELDHYRRVVGN